MATLFTISGVPMAPLLASLKDFDSGLGNNLGDELRHTTLYTLMGVGTCI